MRPGFFDSYSTRVSQPKMVDRGSTIRGSASVCSEAATPYTLIDDAEAVS